MTPLDFYKRQIASGEIFEDPSQLAAIHKLQTLYQHLIRMPQKRRGLMRRVKRNSDYNGVYLWGDVGIGKTYLIDAFFYCLPFPMKLRIHFYQFMREVHESLRKLAGVTNPLRQVARDLSAKARVICFDELIVNDVADAMLLGDLIQALLKEGICLTFTSNFSPDDLYKNGLQRQRFLPAIEAIKTNLEVIHLGTGDDYRLVAGAKAAKRYWHPLTVENYQHVERAFQQSTTGMQVQHDPITLFGREISVKAHAGNHIWFEFENICGFPRSSEDYLAIADTYEVVFISGVRVIGESEHDLARLFIQLIDIFYDAGIILVMCGAVPIEEIYPKGKLVREFERINSRLKQMLFGNW